MPFVSRFIPSPNPHPNRTHVINVNCLKCLNRMYRRMAYVKTIGVGGMRLHFHRGQAARQKCIRLCREGGKVGKFKILFHPYILSATESSIIVALLLLKRICSPGRRNRLLAAATNRFPYIFLLYRRPGH